MQLKELLHIDLSTEEFKDPRVKGILQHLCNLVEALHKENLTLKTENQKLKDEISRLKGEKGKPDIKPKASGEKNIPNKQPEPKKEWNKQSKLDKVKIDDTKVIKYEGALPKDAQHKGYRTVVVQDIVIKTNNIEFHLERYYSPSEGKTYEASLPEYIQGEFGTGLKAWILSWYFNSRMSEQKIHQMLTDIGVSISEGEISNIIIKEHNEFHKERSEIIEAGIKSTPYQHIDDTGARVNGVNQYFTVLCNDYYSAFFINPKKDRLTILDILSQEEELSYLINFYTLSFLKERNLPAPIITSLTSFLKMGGMTRRDFERELRLHIPGLKGRHKAFILDASAIAGYQERHSASIINCLVCDDAKQFHNITSLRALCWIHEERHYKKLIPCLSHHQKLIDKFRSRIWEYYYELTEYKKNPNKKDKRRLSALFDEIFSTETGYEGLDERIQQTKSKKKYLLVVLDHPDTPLHNNPAELAIRQYIIKRKISFGTRTDEGTKAWETFFTIMDTCRKLGVNFRDYIYDRISKQYRMACLSSLIPRAP